MYRNEQGSVILIVIAAASIIGLVAANITLLSSHSLRLLGRTSVSSKERHNAQNQILETALHHGEQSGVLCNSEVGPPPLKLCIAIREEGNIIEIPRLEGELLRPEIVFPWFNYNQIFREAFECPIDIRHGPVLSTAITPIRSSRTCRETLTSTVLKGNLMQDSINLDSSTLAATGFLEISGDLLLSEDTLMVAGGNIWISRIDSADKLPKKLTIVSASGAVVVQNISPHIQTKILAKQWVSAPSTPSFEQDSNQLIPPIISRQILSLR